MSFKLSSFFRTCGITQVPAQEPDSFKIKIKKNRINFYVLTCDILLQYSNKKQRDRGSQKKTYILQCLNILIYKINFCVNFLNKYQMCFTV